MIVLQENGAHAGLLNETVGIRPRRGSLSYRERKRLEREEQQQGEEQGGGGTKKQEWVQPLFQAKARGNDSVKQQGNNCSTPGLLEWNVVQSQRESKEAREARVAEKRRNNNNNNNNDSNKLLDVQQSAAAAFVRNSHTNWFEAAEQ